MSAPDDVSRVPTGFTGGFDAEVVAAWIADDPDPACRHELQELLDTALGGVDVVDTTAPHSREAARAELADRFSGPLEFGTAGLRGAIAAGPARMNRAVVIRAAAGLSAFLADAVGPDFHVVIGCDARFGSHDFAVDTAAVVTAAGGRATLLPLQRPTPLTAFALQHLGADAGVMVTASHNPARDNGYKVYLGERPLRLVYATRGQADGDELAAAGAGAQIVPPFDALIAARIAAVPSVAAVPRAESGWEALDDSITTAYLDAIAGLGLQQEAPLRIVHTAMHGVGSGCALASLERAGFADVHPVAAQQQPDPEFPTVVFPNPEEPGALDLSFATARAVGADLIVANDPDADRFSAAVPDTAADSGWRQLAGDEVGLLLGEFVANRLDEGAWQATADPVFANSIVSSRGLSAVAAAHGISHHTTLTGFKWIARVPGIVYGYEEALGYCIAPGLARDKDGVSAGVAVAALASHLASRGLTIADELTRIRARDGVYLTTPLTIRVEDLALIPAAMERLRQRPLAALGDTPVTEVHDLAAGFGEVPPTDGMVFFAHGNDAAAGAADPSVQSAPADARATPDAGTTAGDRVIIRPSGTEPKLKCYLEAVQPVPGNDPALVAAAVAQAEQRLQAIKSRLAEDLHLG